MALRYVALASLLSGPKSKWGGGGVEREEEWHALVAQGNECKKSTRLIVNSTS